MPLKIGYKLLLMTLILIVPTVYLVFVFYGEKSDSIAFSKKEYLGSQYIHRLAHFMITLSKERVHLSFDGDPKSVSVTRQVRQAIHNAFLAVKEEDHKSKDRFLTSGLIDALRKQINIFDNNELLFREERKNNYKQIFDGSLQLLMQVGDQSNMILDPELDSYYGMSLSIIRIPPLLSYLVQTYDLFVEQDTNRNGNPDLLVVQLASIKSVLDQSYNDLKRFSDNSKNEKTSNQMVNEFYAMRNAAYRYILNMEQQMKQPGEPDWASLQAAYLNAITTLEQFWGLSNRLFQELAQARANRLMATLVTNLLISFLLACFAVLLMYRIGMGIKKPIRLLSDVSSQIQSTSDYSLRVQWNAKDEIGAFVQIFNQLLAQLEQELQRSRHEEELKKANKELAKANADLKQAQVQVVQSGQMALLGQLIAGIAHEVNTPIGVIIAAVGQVKEYHGNLYKEMNQLYAALTDAQRLLYFNVCTSIFMLHELGVSTKEVRTNAKLIWEHLQSLGLDIPESQCQEMAMIGFNEENIDGVAQLLRMPNGMDLVYGVVAFGTNYMHLCNIEIASGRIASLVTALRSYARGSLGAKSETDIREDINTTLVIMHNKLKKGIHVITEYQPVPKLWCYPNQLNQIWTNMIMNAIQAMGGDGQLIIRVFLQGEEHVVVEFEDNGPGIPPEVMGRLFEPYFTTKPKGEGLGIGLSVCKEITQRHGGHIEVKSQPGATCFRIILPLKQSETPEIEQKLAKE